MAEENADKPEDAAAEAKGLAEQFVQTLGLVDLIIGALTLYWVRLWFGSRVTEVLPSSGFTWVDVALLGCAAAFIGKVISSAADLVAAVSDVLRRPTKGPYKRVEDALNNYRTAIDDKSATDDADRIDLAARYLINASPRLRPEVERLYSASILAYSMTLLSFLFVFYFWFRAKDFPKTLIIIQAVAAIAFLAYGLMKQTDYLDEIADNLNHAAAKVKLDRDRLTQSSAASAKPINVTISAVPTISVEMSEVKLNLDDSAVVDPPEKP